MTGSSFPAWLAAHTRHTDEELTLAVSVLRRIALFGRAAASTA